MTVETETIPPQAKRRGRPKQEELPGLETPKNAAIEAAADDYAEVRDARMELTKSEVEKRAFLLDLMHQDHKTARPDGTRAYHRGEYKITVESKEKIKVKIGDEPDDEEAEDED